MNDGHPDNLSAQESDHAERYLEKWKRAEGMTVQHIITGHIGVVKKVKPHFGIEFSVLGIVVEWRGGKTTEEPWEVVQEVNVIDLLAELDDDNHGHRSEVGRTGRKGRVRPRLGPVAGLRRP